MSAVQINVHLDSMCFHAQHRDIYGLEQRDNAGRDCTCSFKPNIATACLSLGSSRKCLVAAETDEMSKKKAISLSLCFACVVPVPFRVLCFVGWLVLVGWLG